MPQQPGVTVHSQVPTVLCVSDHFLSTAGAFFQNMDDQLLLASLEDPTSLHVMPAPALRADAGKVHNSLMLPPAGGPTKRKRKQQVLEEEDYVEALSHIIERDYFPQLAASRAHDEGNSQLDGLSVDSFFQKYTSYDNDSFEELQQKSTEDHQRRYPWLYELPDDEDGKHRRSGMMMLYYLGDKVLTADQRDKMDKIMNGPENVGGNRPNGSQPWRFRVRNQLMFPPELAVSEDVCRMRDHEAPDIVHDRTQTLAQQKCILPADPNSQLLLLNGESGSDKSLNNRTNNLAALQQALVRYNKRYSGPTVRSEKVIQRHNTSLPTPSASSADVTTSTLTSEQLLSWDRSHRARQQAQQLQHLQRYPNASGMRRFVLEEPHTPSLRSSGGGSTVGDSASECSDARHYGSSNKKKDYLPVPMSPCPEPGVGALQSLTPLFTWGSVEGTPLLLHQASPAPGMTPFMGQGQGAGTGLVAGRLSTDQESDTRESRRMKALQQQAYEEEEKGLPRFTLAPTSQREMLARSIDTHTQQAHSTSGAGKAKISLSTASSSRGSGGSVVSGKRSRTSSSDVVGKAGRAAMEDSDEMSVADRRDYYRSANFHATQQAHQPSPAPSVRSSSSSFSSKHKNHLNSSTSSLSTAQRLARLTPAAKALALKLHKNLASIPSTPLS